MLNASNVEKVQSGSLQCAHPGRQVK